jgi:gamma-glutamylputrescine oxidase
VSTSFWLDRPYIPRAPLERPITADAAIVGAGMTGVAIGYFLRKRGIDAVILEKGIVAGAATGRNTGFMISGLGEHYAGSVAFWGRAQAAEITRIHLRNQDRFAAIAAEHRIQCDLERSGSFAVAIDSAEEELLRQSCALLKEDGFSCDFFPASEMNRALGSAGFLGGTFNPHDGHVDPVRLVRGVAKILDDSGCRIFENSPVIRLSANRGSWVVETPKGSIEVARLFLASNAWLPGLRHGLPIEPVRGQCLAVLPSPGARIAEIPCLTNYASEYWRGAGEHVLFGGMRRFDTPGEDAGVSAPVQGAIEGFYLRHFPRLQNSPVTHRWSGLMAYTPDGLPLIGRLPDEENAFVSSGYTGHGFGYAFLAGEWLAELAIDGKDAIPALCRIDRPMRISPCLKEI